MLFVKLQNNLTLDMTRPAMKHLFLIVVMLYGLTPFAAASHSLDVSKAAVLLIDMQTGFFDWSLQYGVPKPDALIQEQIELLKWAVSKKVPVLIFEYTQSGRTDEQLTRIIDDQANKHYRKSLYRRITKHNANGFLFKSGEQANKQLKQWGVTQLIVTGINAEFCVKATIRGALGLGFQVFSSDYLVASQNPTLKYPNHDWFFEDKSLYELIPNWRAAAVN